MGEGTRRQPSQARNVEPDQGVQDRRPDAPVQAVVWLRVDLRRGDARERAWAIRELADAPAGTTVLLEVGRGDLVPGVVRAVDWSALRVVVCAPDHRTARPWLEAIGEVGGRAPRDVPAEAAEPDGRRGLTRFRDTQARLQADRERWRTDRAAGRDATDGDRDPVEETGTVGGAHP